jgi:hypothetical protein
VEIGADGALYGLTKSVMFLPLLRSAHLHHFMEYVRHGRSPKDAALTIGVYCALPKDTVVWGADDLALVEF